MPTVVIRRDISPGGLSSIQAGYAAARSYITQVSGSNSDLTYFFPYTPVEVTFDSVGAEYQQIDRPGNYALIDRKAPNLLKAGFEFRVAHRPSNGLQDISRDLEFLRKIASQDAPVVVGGLGTYFEGVRYLSETELGSVMFRVADLSVRVTRRGMNNEPWQADCRLDLVEDRNPIISIVSLSPITYSDTVTPTVVKSSGSKKKSTPATTTGTTRDISEESKDDARKNDSDGNSSRNSRIWTT